MRWYAISGSWRKTDERVRNDVVDAVRSIVAAGDGIVTGGALGVDFIAAHVVLNEGDPVSQLRLYLPTPLDDFCRHYEKRAREGVISGSQARMVVSQLRRANEQAPDAIHDSTGFERADTKSYYARNTRIIEACDELYAFQVNESRGTQDAIDKTRQMGKPVHVYTYSL